jgi:hypothetical protein
LQAHALEHPFHHCRRLCSSAAAGEGQHPPPLFLSLLVRQGLTELVLQQDDDHEPSLSQFEGRRSAARSAAVVGLLRRLISFAFKLAQLLYAW